MHFSTLQHLKSRLHLRREPEGVDFPTENTPPSTPVSSELGNNPSSELSNFGIVCSYLSSAHFSIIYLFPSSCSILTSLFHLLTLFSPVSLHFIHWCYLFVSFQRPETLPCPSAQKHFPVKSEYVWGLPAWLWDKHSILIWFSRIFCTCFFLSLSLYLIWFCVSEQCMIDMPLYTVCKGINPHLHLQDNQLHPIHCNMCGFLKI